MLGARSREMQIKWYHISSEMGIIKSSLFGVGGRLTDHSPLYDQGTGTESRGQEREKAYEHAHFW